MAECRLLYRIHKTCITGTVLVKAQNYLWTLPFCYSLFILNLILLSCVSLIQWVILNCVANKFPWLLYSPLIFLGIFTLLKRLKYFWKQQLFCSPQLVIIHINQRVRYALGDCYFCCVHLIYLETATQGKCLTNLDCLPYFSDFNGLHFVLRTPFWKWVNANTLQISP